MGGISIWQLVIVLIIVLLIFGTKKFKNMGADLGNAVKGFKNVMDEEKPEEKKNTDNIANNKVESAAIDVEVTKKKEDVDKKV